MNHKDEGGVSAPNCRQKMPTWACNLELRLGQLHVEGWNSSAAEDEATCSGCQYLVEPMVGYGFLLIGAIPSCPKGYRYPGLNPSDSEETGNDLGPNRWPANDRPTWLLHYLVLLNIGTTANNGWQWCFTMIDIGSLMCNWCSNTA